MSMAHARVDADWNHTAALLWMQANIHRDPKKHGPYSIDEFHPMRRATKGVAITADNIGMLKALLKEPARRN